MTLRISGDWGVVTVSVVNCNYFSVLRICALFWIYINPFLNFNNYAWLKVLLHLAFLSERVFMCFNEVSSRSPCENPNIYHSLAFLMSSKAFICACCSFFHLFNILLKSLSILTGLTDLTGKLLLTFIFNELIPALYRDNSHTIAQKVWFYSL